MLEPDVARYVTPDQVRGMPYSRELVPVTGSHALSAARSTDKRALVDSPDVWVAGKNAEESVVVKANRLVMMIQTEEPTFYRKRFAWPNKFRKLARSLVDGRLSAVRVSKAGSYRRMVNLPGFANGDDFRQDQAWKLWSDALLHSTRFTWGISRADAALTLHAAHGALSKYIQAHAEDPAWEARESLSRRCTQLSARAARLQSAVALF